MSKLLPRLNKLEARDLRRHFIPHRAGPAFDRWRDNLIANGRAKPFDRFETLLVEIVADTDLEPLWPGTILISL